MDVLEAIGKSEQRYLWLSVIVGLVILAGVWAAIWWEGRGPQVKEEGEEVIISEITLAGLRTADEANKKNPALKQQNNYPVGESLALRITTAEGVTAPIQVSVRLLSAEGRIVPLSPASVEFEPGTSTFCCWKIEEPGKYQLQIFRPERTVTTLPLTITGGGKDQRSRF